MIAQLELNVQSTTTVEWKTSKKIYRIKKLIKETFVKKNGGKDPEKTRKRSNEKNRLLTCSTHSTGNLYGVRSMSNLLLRLLCLFNLAIVPSDRDITPLKQMP